MPVARARAVANLFAFGACIMFLLTCGSAQAQDAAGPASSQLRISPTFSTMLVNETRSFTLNGEGGQTLHGAQWSIAGDAVAVSATDPPIATAVRPGRAVLRAVLGGSSALAWITVTPGGKLPVGTVRWSNPRLPGSAPVAMSASRGSPGPNEPDLVTDEITPRGVVMRAFSPDGRELWRHNIAPSLVPPGAEADEEAPPVRVPARQPVMTLSEDGSMVYAANLDRGPVGVTTVGAGGRIISHYRFGGPSSAPNASSDGHNGAPPTAIKECRSLVPGMTKEQVLELFGPKMSLPRDQFEQGTWRVPASPEMDCVIVFDAQGRVLTRRFAVSDKQ